VSLTSHEKRAGLFGRGFEDNVRFAAESGHESFPQKVFPQLVGPKAGRKYKIHLNPLFLLGSEEAQVSPEPPLISQKHKSSHVGEYSRRSPKKNQKSFAGDQA
jgi:hypothetical protein